MRCKQMKQNEIKNKMRNEVKVETAPRARDGATVLHRVPEVRGGSASAPRAVGRLRPWWPRGALWWPQGLEDGQAAALELGHAECSRSAGGRRPALQRARGPERPSCPRAGRVLAARPGPTGVGGQLPPAMVGAGVTRRSLAVSGRLVHLNSHVFILQAVPGGQATTEHKCPAWGD